MSSSRRRPQPPTPDQRLAAMLAEYLISIGRGRVQSIYIFGDTLSEPRTHTINLLVIVRPGTFERYRKAFQYINELDDSDLRANRLYAAMQSLNAADLDYLTIGHGLNLWLMPPNWADHNAKLSAAFHQAPSLSTLFADCEEITPRA